MTRLVLGALAAALGFPLAAPTSTSVAAGPPWISIEHPVNPYDPATRGAFLMVNAFHHGTPVGIPVSGTAEGLVDGQRRSVKLEFGRTSRTGVYALRQQWPGQGLWTLVISVSQGEDDAATAVVDLGVDGSVAKVAVPTRQQGEWTLPAKVALADVDASLRARAREVARR